MRISNNIKQLFMLRNKQNYNNMISKADNTFYNVEHPYPTEQEYQPVWKPANPHSSYQKHYVSINVSEHAILFMLPFLHYHCQQPEFQVQQKLPLEQEEFLHNLEIVPHWDHKKRSQSRGPANIPKNFSLIRREKT